MGQPAKRAGAGGAQQSQYFVDMSKRQFPKPAVFWSPQERTAFSLNRMEQARLESSLGHMSMHRRSTLRDLQSGMLCFARRRLEYDRLRAALGGVVDEAMRSQCELHRLSGSVEERLRGGGATSAAAQRSGGGGQRSATEIVDTAEISRLFGFRVERCLRTSASLKKSAAGRLQSQANRAGSVQSIDDSAAAAQPASTAAAAAAVPSRPHTAGPRTAS